MSSNFDDEQPNLNDDFSPFSKDDGRVISVEVQKQSDDGKKSRRKNKKMKNANQGQIYSNMKAREIVLFIGFALTAVAFVFAALSVFMLFFNMESMVPESQTTASLTKIFSTVALATSFVGVVLSVAGANTHKGFAKLSFFFAIIGFFAGLVMWLFSSLGVFLFG